MCEANAYVKETDQEVLFMESVDSIEPFDDGLKLIDIFGRQKFIKAHIQNVSLLNHRIILSSPANNHQTVS
ncbi:MAG: CooT family nickel-binding protein [Peptococcaceae bacterium]|jgi:predicted RNA-binding protein|nr:CooT family nickel-binding protein [Peptococcaceae bacterium]